MCCKPVYKANPEFFNFGKLRTIKDFLINRYKDTLGIVLIGSFADGSYEPDSDVDIVWVKRRRIGLKKLFFLKRHLGEKVQLILFSQKGIKEHFKYFTTMAHSIKNGIIVYEKGGFITNLLKKELTLPDKQWMKQWFNHWPR